MVELLISVFIIGLISVAVGNFAGDVFSFNAIFSGSLNAQGDARRVFKSANAEIRSASQSSLGSFPIDTANSTAFSFYSDADRDGLKERIRYFLVGTTLKKGVLKPTGSPLVYNVANEKQSEVVHDIANGATPMFSYYAASYDGTTAPLTIPVDLSSIRLVKMTFIIDHDVSRPPTPLTMTTQVSIRNLKDNL